MAASRWELIETAYTKYTYNNNDNFDYDYDYMELVYFIWRRPPQNFGNILRDDGAVGVAA